MEDIVLLEWAFSPKDYFEEEIKIDRETYSIVFKEGKVEARIDPTIYNNENNMRDTLHSIVDDRFLGVQLVTHKHYELSKASMCRLHADGRRDITVFPEPIVMTVTVNSPDIVIKDQDGNIVSDTRRERIEKKNKFATLSEKYRSIDKIDDSILKSYNSAVTDPQNELVHLYEVREALSSRFGGERATREELGISRSKWSKLGKLSNEEPFKQGRHRGKKPGELRDATEIELKEAREIALYMIESYLEYLEEENSE